MCSAMEVLILQRNITRSQFLGWGHQLEQKVVYGSGFGQPEWSGQHSVYNIRTATSVPRFITTPAPRETRSTALSRAFYSPLTRLPEVSALGNMDPHPGAR